MSMMRIIIVFIVEENIAPVLSYLFYLYENFLKIKFKLNIF